MKQSPRGPGGPAQALHRLVQCGTLSCQRVPTAQERRQIDLAAGPLRGSWRCFRQGQPLYRRGFQQMSPIVTELVQFPQDFSEPAELGSPLAG